MADPPPPAATTVASPGFVAPVLMVTLAGVAEGVWPSVDDLASIWSLEAQFDAQVSIVAADRGYDGWRHAVERSLRWAEPGG